MTFGYGFTELLKLSAPDIKGCVSVGQTLGDLRDRLHHAGIGKTPELVHGASVCGFCFFIVYSFVNSGKYYSHRLPLNVSRCSSGYHKQVIKNRLKQIVRIITVFLQIVDQSFHRL